MILKKNFKCVEFDSTLTVKPSTKFYRLNHKYAILYTLSGGKNTSFKVIPIRFMKQFHRLIKVRCLLNRDKEDLEENSFLKIKCERLINLLKIKIEKWGS